MDAQNEQTSQAIAQSIITRPSVLTNMPLAQILDSLPETIIDFDDKDEIVNPLTITDGKQSVFHLSSSLRDFRE